MSTCRSAELPKYSVPCNCCYLSGLTIAATAGFAGVDFADLQLTSSSDTGSACSSKLSHGEVLKPQGLETSFSNEIS